jgi:hypothetical protein
MSPLASEWLSPHPPEYLLSAAVNSYIPLSAVDPHSVERARARAPRWSALPDERPWRPGPGLLGFAWVVGRRDTRIPESERLLFALALPLMDPRLPPGSAHCPRPPHTMPREPAVISGPGASSCLAPPAGSTAGAWSEARGAERRTFGPALVGGASGPQRGPP